ncbi:hypothetical protein H0H92_009748 [Tricholoma furcatifolium]|nr:hypothetical protein H0H92_009748 [Tricholoma furcatifolium]
MPRGSKSSKRTFSKLVAPTAVRRFFKLELLAKRRSDLSPNYNNLDPVVDTPPPNPPSRDPFCSSVEKENADAKPSPIPSRRNFPLSVALMNEDPALDALVVSTLSVAPFCCHEDLLTLPRDQLVDAARVLNERLPAALTIATDSTVSNGQIRASIERIVGLRPNEPAAPKPDSDVLERGAACKSAQTHRTPPTSPLASRSHNQSYARLGSLLSPGGLHRLVEEDENNEDSFDVDGDGEVGRDLKKRRIVVEDTGGESDDGSDTDTASDPEQTPTPLPRTMLMQRARTAYAHDKVAASPTPVPVLRSRSQPAERVSYSGIDTVFMDDKNTSARYQRKTDTEQSSILAELDLKEPLKPIGAPRRSGRLRPIARHRSAHDMELNAPSVSILGEKRKRGVNSAEATHQVVSGFKNLTVRCGE